MLYYILWYVLERSYLVAFTFLINMLLLQTGIFCRIFVPDICEYVPESALFLWLYKNKLYIFTADNKILKEICRHLSLLIKNTRTPINDICHRGLLTACEQDQEGPSWSCSQAVSKPVWHTLLLCVQWKTPDDGQRNCPKHIEFYSKNKFEKLVVVLVGFVIRIY